MRVFKFGGASIQNADSIKNVSQIIERHHTAGPLVVVISALGKTTNAMEQVVQTIYSKDAEAALKHIDNIKSNHLDIATNLYGNSANEAITELNLLFEKLYDLQRFYTLKSITVDKGYDFLYDLIVSYGELLSTTLVSRYLQHIGVPVYWLDIRTVLKTNHNYREAEVNWEVTRELVRSKIPPLAQDNVIITQGFIGGTVDNDTTTLGREGSDFSAAILANCLDAEDVTIWKDVPGVLNADPRIFPKTELLSHISYSEAVELAYYGATVIHPKTLKPIQNKGIPLRVRSFVDPDAPGTTIDGINSNDTDVASVIVKGNQVLLHLSPKDFSFILEQHLSQIFKTFADHKVKVGIIQNSAIKFSACIECHENRLSGLLEELNRAFNVSTTEGVTLITVRHPKTDTVEQAIDGKKVLLNQQSETMSRFVIQD